jgi:DNA replication protein DnaC
LKSGKRFHQFVSSGAGTGKSLLIQAIYQAGVKFYAARPGVNPDNMTVVVSTFTGKAVYSICGATMHSLFCLPISQYQANMPQLLADVAKNLSFQYANIKLVFIDEISMVGHRQFLQVDKENKTDI